ncbi:MAG: DMT family protein [Pirellulaceae bacterium]
MSLVLWKTAGLLVLSNVFLTFHLMSAQKNLDGKPWMIAVLVSWGIAFFEEGTCYKFLPIALASCS